MPRPGRRILRPFPRFAYSSEIRRLIYTTSIIEGFHRQHREVTKTEGAFLRDEALISCCMGFSRRSPTRGNVRFTTEIEVSPQVNMTRSPLSIIFGDRLR